MEGETDVEGGSAAVPASVARSAPPSSVSLAGCCGSLASSPACATVRMAGVGVPVVAVLLIVVVAYVAAMPDYRPAMVVAFAAALIALCSVVPPTAEEEEALSQARRSASSGGGGGSRRASQPRRGLPAAKGGSNVRTVRDLPPMPSRGG